jgi:hypothetical protein
MTNIGAAAGGGRQPAGGRGRAALRPKSRQHPPGSHPRAASGRGLHPAATAKRKPSFAGVHRCALNAACSAARAVVSPAGIIHPDPGFHAALRDICDRWVWAGRKGVTQSIVCGRGAALHRAGHHVSFRRPPTPPATPTPIPTTTHPPTHRPTHTTTATTHTHARTSPAAPAPCSSSMRPTPSALGRGGTRAPQACAPTSLCWASRLRVGGLLGPALRAKGGGGAWMTVCWASRLRVGGRLGPALRAKGGGGGLGRLWEGQGPGERSSTCWQRSGG